MSERLTKSQILDQIQYWSMGTDNYYVWSHMFRRHLITDGVQWLAESAGAWWLLDTICSHFYKNAVRREVFQAWTLKRLPATAKNKAKLTGTDGNDKVITQQLIPYTDFPLDEITLFVEWNGENWIVSLAQEH